MRNYLHARRVLIAAAAAAGGLAGFGCTDNSGSGPGNPGAGGTSAGTAGTTGTGGTGGTSSGGAGGGGGATPGFMSVLPCMSQSAYATGTTTVNFGVSNALTYDPKCLKVPAGTTVTFSGDFATHPLTPSAKRGTLTGNPITASNGLPLPDGGMSESFAFPTAGFYAYYCAEHSDDSGNFMDGVIWVQ